MSIQSTCFLLECPFLEATLQIPLLREGAIKGTKFPDDTGKVSSSFIAEYYQSIYEAMYMSGYLYIYLYIFCSVLSYRIDSFKLA